MAASDGVAEGAGVRWSKPVLDRGFTIVPNLLLSHQEELGLPGLQCLLLIHLLTYWWESGKNPYPSKAVLARRMGVSERQIQRYISDLIKNGFLRRKREDLLSKSGRFILSFDLSGLVEKLRSLDKSIPTRAETPTARKARTAALP